MVINQSAANNKTSPNKTNPSVWFPAVAAVISIKFVNQPATVPKQKFQQNMY